MTRVDHQHIMFWESNQVMQIEVRGRYTIEIYTSSEWLTSLGLSSIYHIPYYNSLPKSNCINCEYWIHNYAALHERMRVDGSEQRGKKRWRSGLNEQIRGNVLVLIRFENLYICFTTAANIRADGIHARQGWKCELVFWNVVYFLITVIFKPSYSRQGICEGMKWVGYDRCNY